MCLTSSLLLSQCLQQSRDRKSTRLNSSHLGISYAVFCLKKTEERTDRAENSPVDARRSCSLIPTLQHDDSTLPDFVSSPLSLPLSLVVPPCPCRYPPHAP